MAKTDRVDAAINPLLRAGGHLPDTYQIEDEAQPEGGFTPAASTEGHRTMSAEKNRVARGVTPAQEIEDLIADAINDSFDMDWTARDGARAVMRWLADEGMAIVDVPPPFNRGDECPNHPGHRCQVDTSMESGPNNCFHCERPM